jgi:uncharacterized membrane protein YccC
MRALGRSAVAALRPGPNPLAVAAGLRTLIPAAGVAVVGAVTGQLQAVGVAYLGAACAAAFLVGGVFWVRMSTLVVQSIGAAIGISLGVLLPTSAVSLIATAAAAGFASGLIGAVGPSAPGFGMMLSIGVAFGQFGGSALPWWQQVLGYLVGTALVTVAALSPWLFRRSTLERQLLAEVFVAAADLCAVVGTEDARPARVRLAAASAAARTGSEHPRAELLAFAAAILYGQGQSVPAAAVAAIRAAAAQVRAGTPVSVPVTFDRSSPGLQALADSLSASPSRPAEQTRPKRSLRAVIRGMGTRSAVANGTRTGLCMAVATAITVALHETNHAFWLALTVAVIVRPEYGSVFVRTVNRVCGSLVGALLAAMVLHVVPSGLPVATAAGLALCFAVMTAPKLYALAVIGITNSALLAGSIGAADPVLPGIRLLDTVIGAAVAIVFGYLLWPGARRLPVAARLGSALAAARDYLGEAIKPPGDRVRYQARRDDAYRLAHQARQAAEAALREPPPVSTLASEVIPGAIAVEEVVDLITAIAAAVDAGHQPGALVDDVERRLRAIS